MPKSKRQLLYHTPYLDLYKTDKNFYYSERKGVNSVAILCFKKNNQKGGYEFLVHYQVMPQIKEKKKPLDLYACPITGSFDQGDSYLTCAIREIYEEGGILVSKKNLICCNKTVATTQMNEQIYHMVFDVSNLKQDVPPTDGSYFESLAKNKWLNQKALEKLLFDENTIKLNSLLTCYLLWQKHFQQTNNI